MVHFTSGLLSLALVLGAVDAAAAPAPSDTTNVNVNATRGFSAVHKRSPFTINLGNTGNEDVAWVSGDNKCTRVVVSPANENPCGKEFSLHGQSGFVINGCGGPLYITQDGNFWAGCVGLKEKDKCSVHSSYKCQS